MTEIMELMSTYGFPMVVAAYLLVRIDKRLASLEGVIRELTTVIQGTFHGEIK